MVEESDEDSPEALLDVDDDRERIFLMGALYLGGVKLDIKSRSFDIDSLNSLFSRSFSVIETLFPVSLRNFFNLRSKLFGNLAQFASMRFTNFLYFFLI